MDRRDEQFEPDEQSQRNMTRAGTYGYDDRTRAAFTKILKKAHFLIKSVADGGKYLHRLFETR